MGLTPTTNLGLYKIDTAADNIDPVTDWNDNWDKLDAWSVTTDATLAAAAVDADVVHNTADESIEGIKTFASAPVVPDASFDVAKLSGLGNCATLDVGTATGTVAAGDDARFAHPAVVTIAVAGTLTATTGTLRYPITSASTIKKVRAMVGTAPAAQAVILDVNKNGTTIYTSQGNRPTIAIAAHDSGAGTAPNVTALAAGDYLSLDVDQIGVGTTGSDLVVLVELTIP